MLLMANAGVVSVTAGTAPETSARLVGHRLQAFAGPGAAPLPPPLPRGGCCAPCSAPTGRARPSLSA